LVVPFTAEEMLRIATNMAVAAAAPGDAAAKVLLDRETRVQRKLAERLGKNRAARLAKEVLARDKLEGVLKGTRAKVKNALLLRGGSRLDRNNESTVELLAGNDGGCRTPEWGRWDDARDGDIEAYDDSEYADVLAREDAVAALARQRRERQQRQQAGSAAAEVGGCDELAAAGGGQRRRSSRRRGSDLMGVEVLAAELVQRRELLSMFQMFDQDGSGQIDLAEMQGAFDTQLSGELGAGVRRRIADHFSYMDKDGNGAVDFAEFQAATLGAADQVFGTLGEELSAREHGEDLYVLLKRLRRKQILEESERHAAAGEALEAFAALAKLPAVDMFAVGIHASSAIGERAGREAARARGERKAARARRRKRACAAQRGATGLTAVTAAEASGKVASGVLVAGGAATAGGRVSPIRSSSGARAAGGPIPGVEKREQRQLRRLMREQREVLASARAALAAAPQAGAVVSPSGALSPSQRVSPASELRTRRRKGIAKLGGSLATSAFF
jgi:hypothetical protein